MARGYLVKLSSRRAGAGIKAAHAAVRDLALSGQVDGFASFTSKTGAAGSSRRVRGRSFCSTTRRLLVATDGASATLGYDRRRFRPNLLVAGVPGLAERDWEGRTLRVGGALIGVVSLRQRCIMTTFDPDTAEQDTEVLLRLHRELGGSFALDCDVVQPGAVRVGDDVELR